MAKGIEISIADFQRMLEKQAKQAEADSRKFVTMASAEVERTAKRIMVESPTNPDVSYGKKHHHPSYAGNPPAPDTGTLMRSITHSVTVKGNEVVGEVGSIIHDSDYPRYLEYGTSKMKPRPWLSTALEKSQNFMVQAFQKIMKGEE